MELIITHEGSVRCVYGEEIELGSIGQLQITRASVVEPDPMGQWCADLSPVGGPMLGPFAQRSAALAAETQWLRRNLF